MTFADWFRAAVSVVIGFALLSLLGCVSQEGSVDSTPRASAGSTLNTASDWPELPRTGFVRGRAATRADAQAGNAVFVASVGDESIGEPINIVIPQYALVLDDSTGVRTRAIVVQAERARGIDLVGLVMVSNGEKMVAELSELELLGQRVPHVSR